MTSPFRIDHILVGTSDFAGTVAWYQRAFDAQIETEWTVAEAPDLQLAYLRIGDFKLEVIGTSQSIPGALRAEDFASHLRTSGFTHLCFRVGDVDHAMNELAQRNIPAFIPPKDYANPGVRIAFVQDNNGNVIEFIGPQKDNEKGNQKGVQQ